MTALLVATVLALCGRTSAPGACTCVPGPPLTNRSLVREAASRYQAVLEGTIVNVQSVRAPRDSAAGEFPLDEAVATIRVARSWRGRRTDTVVVRTPLYTTACGLGFRTGDHYLLFASQVNETLYADNCGPSRKWDKKAERLAGWLGRGHVTPVPNQADTPRLVGRWQLHLRVTGPAAKSAGPREASGPIELRRLSTGPVPRGLQWVYNITYDTTLHAMFGPPKSGPAQAVLKARDSVELAFNPFVDHGAFRLAGVIRGDSIVGTWHRTNFANDGYRGSFTLKRTVRFAQ